MTTFRQLDASKIVETVRELRDRISERFPESSLFRVASELHQVATETRERIHRIRRSNWALRGLIGIGVVGLVASLVMLFARVRIREETFSFLGDVLQVFEEGLSSIFFLGAILLFLVTLDNRLKRRRALQAIHELRSFAHIVDMHQLTKDPERVLHPGPDTSSSPDRRLTPFELGRYLDYCSELLSLIGKLSALYVQGFPDPVVLDAVDAMEDLTTGGARKIWQKLMILDRGGVSES